MNFRNISSRLLTRVASLEVALGILIILCLASIPGTFLEDRHAYYGNILFVTLILTLATSLFCCTCRRLKTLAASVLILHVGVLVVLSGFVVREVSGTVATINVYEGETVDSFYLPHEDLDIALGFSLLVKKVTTEYYPVPVKIGVLKGVKQHSLHTVKTGDNFLVEKYRINAEQFNRRDQLLTLVVHDGERLVGKVDTQGKGDLPADFPLSFRLVAYQTPNIARSWLDLQVTAKDMPPITGRTEINHPLVVNRYHFYYVQKAYDDQGRSYVGIQIVKDPGRPIVFLGMGIVALGALLASYRRFNEAR